MVESRSWLAVRTRTRNTSRWMGWSGAGEGGDASPRLLIGSAGGTGRSGWVLTVRVRPGLLLLNFRSVRPREARRPRHRVWACRRVGSHDALFVACGCGLALSVAAGPAVRSGSLARSPRTNYPSVSVPRQQLTATAGCSLLVLLSYPHETSQVRTKLK